jgi:hypothetical protein
MPIELIRIKQVIPERPYYVKKIVRICPDSGKLYTGMGVKARRIEIPLNGIVENPIEYRIPIFTEVTKEQYISGFHFYGIHTNNEDILGYWINLVNINMPENKGIIICEIPQYCPIIIGSERTGFDGLAVMVAQRFSFKMLFPCDEYPKGL